MPANGLVSSGTMLHKIRSSSIEEVLSKSVDSYIPALDKFGKAMVSNSKAQVPTQQIGRDYLYITHFQPALASGRLRPTSQRGDSWLFGESTSRYGGTNGRMFRQTQTNTLPQSDGTNPIPIRFAIGLRGVEDAMPVTYDELQLAANDAVLGPSMMANKVKGYGRMLAQFYINAVYTDPSTNYKLVNLGPSTGSALYSIGSSTVRQITFTPPSKQYDRLMPGQQVDLFNGTTRVNELAGTRIRMVVDSVDAMYGKVVLSIEPSTSALSNANYDVVFTTLTIGESGYLVDPGNYDSVNAAFNGIAGMNAWIKSGDTSGSSNTNDNCLLGADRVEQGSFGGAVNVNVHPELKSLIQSVGDTMTEHKFRLILDQWYRHHGKYGHYLDTAVWSVGALRAYEQTKIGQIRLEHSATGQLANEGAASGLKFTHGGRSYTFEESNAIDAGQCYIIRTGGGNIRRIVPPYAAGTKTAPFGDEGTGLPIRLIAPALTGENSILARNAAGQPLAATDTPFICYMQWLWNQPASIKLTDLTEDRQDS